MTNRLIWRTIAGAGALAALLAAPPSAQPPTDDDSERAVTPTRSAPSRGADAEKTAAPLDWQTVRATLREGRARDDAYNRELQEPGALTRTARPRPDGLRSMPAGQLRLVDPREVQQTRVPLLAPLTADTAATLRVIARENAYTATAELPGGALVQLLGTRLRLVGGGETRMRMRQAQRARFQARLAGIDAPYVVSRHEEGIDLSFSKFGAAYLITVNCPDPDEDARCADESFIRSLAQNLSILNESEGDGR